MTATYATTKTIGMLLLGMVAGVDSIAAPPDLAPIKIGSISTLTGGPAAFVSTGLAAKAFFDNVNAAGGIQKRKIQYTIEDDKGKPELAAQAAARLVNEQKVVALAGGASVLECGVNEKTYLQAGIVSISGLGLDRGCFTSAMIAPVNAGPNIQLALALQFATDQLKSAPLCVMRLGEPVNLKNSFDATVKQWSSSTEVAIALDASNIQYSDSPEPYFAQALKANCKAIVFAGPEPFVIRYATEGRKALGSGVKFVFIGSAYTNQFAQALGALGEGMYAMSEFEPWSSRSGALSNWRNLMAVNKVPITSASQGGYVSAQVLVHVLRSIKGEITRESVTAGFQALDTLNSPMTGMPFTFGMSTAHHPNQAAIPMQLSGGKWRIAHHDWIKPKK